MTFQSIMIKEMTFILVPGRFLLISQTSDICLQDCSTSFGRHNKHISADSLWAENKTQWSDNRDEAIDDGPKGRIRLYQSVDVSIHYREMPLRAYSNKGKINESLSNLKKMQYYVEQRK